MFASFTFIRVIALNQPLIHTNPELLQQVAEGDEQAFSTLPADEQEIFRMQREQGLTYQQIAEQKGISVKTVEKKMSHALRQLRGGMDKALLLAIASHLLR